MFQVFNGDLEVKKDVVINLYNGENMTRIAERVDRQLNGNSTSAPVIGPASSMLAKLQENPDHQFSDFEFFEQIQVIPLQLPRGTSNVTSMFFK